MKISELIDELKKFNPDAEISRDDSETIWLSYICNDGATPETTKMVFIEMADYEDCGCGSEY